MHSRSAATVSGPLVSTRRLTFTVFGTTGDLPPHAIRDALGFRAQVARTAGYRDAAAAFEAARGHLTRAIRATQSADNSSSAGARRGQDPLLAATVEHVRRAYALLPQPCPEPLRAPATPPDPALIDDPVALLEDLRALGDWSGATVQAITDSGTRRHLRVSEAHLLATLHDGVFPDPTVTEVIARGCGLPEQLCGAWIAARHRAARAFLSDRHLAAQTAPAAAVSARAALDPRDAESPVQLAALLAELKERCGLSYGEMVQAAKRAECAVSWTRLWAVGTRFAFPTPRVLEAFLAGCGIDPARREPWRQARKRLASGHGRIEHTVHAELAAAREPVDPPPDPRGVRTWAQFSAMLRSLVRWSDLSVAEIAQQAITAGTPVNTDALRHMLVHRALPGPSTLDAFTVGCGLSSAQQFQWRMTRARLAAAAPEARHLPSRALRPTEARYPQVREARRS